MGGRMRGGRLRRVRRPRVPLGQLDVRGVHQAGRHVDLAGLHRPAARPRTELDRARAIHVRGDADVEPDRRLPGRRVPAPRRRARADGHRFGVALPALRRIPGGDARTRDLRRPGARDRVTRPACSGRLHRRAARAALRLFPLGRAEGGCVRCDPDSRRRAHAARARTWGASSQCAPAGHGDSGVRGSAELLRSRLDRSDARSSPDRGTVAAGSCVRLDHGGIHRVRGHPLRADAASRGRVLERKGIADHVERTGQPPASAQRAASRRHLARRRLPRAPLRTSI